MRLGYWFLGVFLLACSAFAGSDSSCADWLAKEFHPSLSERVVRLFRPSKEVYLEGPFETTVGIQKARSGYDILVIANAIDREENSLYENYSKHLERLERRRSVYFDEFLPSLAGPAAENGVTIRLSEVPAPRARSVRILISGFADQIRPWLTLILEPEANVRVGE